MVKEAPATPALKQALRQRLEQAIPQIQPSLAADDLTTMELLSRLSAEVRRTDDRAQLWLLFTCVSGVMPTRDELLRCARFLQLSEPGFEHFEMLRACAGAASVNENFDRTIRVVDNTTVVDVDFCARHGHNTGVQRVVRETVARWNTIHPLTLSAWTEDGFVMRSLVPDERARVLEWDSSRRTEASAADVDSLSELIVPWNSAVILPEVAQHRVWERLACLAEFSSNTVGMVGYDAIPVTSAEFVIPSESDRFVRYLSIVKYADLIAGISGASAEEFAGFADALDAQGLHRPDVVTVMLPIALAREEVESAGLTERDSSRALVLCVGTQEPRKNQLAVLAASESLWQKGLEFDLLFIGGAAMPLSVPFDIEVDRLRRVGRTVTVLRNGSDAILERAYRDARFSVFVSLHEGFGLPIGESLAAGTPVITTNYGSMAEIAAGGGCVLVDPRDDDDIAAAMRRLLTDDAELATLAAEANARTPRTWDDYATELWTAFSSMGATP